MGFLAGFRHFIGGFEAAFSPPVRQFILLPALVSLVVISLGIYVAFIYVAALSEYLHGLGWWPAVLDWLIEPLLYLLAVLIGAWLFGFIAALVGSPFYGDLSLRADPRGEPDDTPWYKQLGPTAVREWAKLRYTLPRLLGLLLLGFIPVVNLVAPFLWLTYGGWLMAVQFCDYSFENRRQTFQETLQTLRQNRAGCIGLGLPLTFAMAIPVLNFVVAPVAVVAASRYVRSLREKY